MAQRNSELGEKKNIYQPIYIWLHNSSPRKPGDSCQGTAERLNPQIRFQQQLLEVFVLHSNQGDDCRLWPHHGSWDPGDPWDPWE